MKRLVCILFLVLAYANIAQALMPPSVYAERSEKSKIKAIALIKQVDLNEETGENTVTFQTEYALTPNTPETFIGTCFSAVTHKQKTMVGGTVYFYPEVGQRVFVTISEEHGRITSMTAMTPELETAIKNSPESIRYGISKAYIELK